MRPSMISEIIHNDPWHKYPADVRTIWVVLTLVIALATSGCARQIAPMTAVTRADIIGDAITVTKKTEIVTDASGKSVTKVTIDSQFVNASAVDKSHKDRESDNRTKVGVEQAGRKNAEMLARIMMMGAQGYGGAFFSQQGGSPDLRCRGECGTTRPYNSPRQ